MQQPAVLLLEALAWRANRPCCRRRSMRSTATTRSLMCATRRPVRHSTTCRPTKSTSPFRRYPEFMESCMKRRTGPPRLYLASPVTKKTPVANSEERLHSVLATLEKCRTVLLNSGNRETAQLVSVAILELRMKLNRIGDSELKAFCDAMWPHVAPAESSQAAKPPQGQRRRPSLKLVK
jgi:hypothetical protein